MRGARPNPICAVCGVPVKKVTCWRNDHDYTFTYEAQCHGEIQRFTITDDMLNKNMYEPEIGRAFEPQQQALEKK